MKHPSEFTAVGESLDVVVLEVDQENRRLSLGHKQLEENPWDVFESVFTVGSVHEGTVTAFVDKGATIALAYGVEGYVSMKNLTKEDGSTAKLEEKLEFKVLEFNKNTKRIVLSHSKLFEDVKREEAAKEVAKEKEGEDTTQKAVKKLKANLEKTTLGDISELAALKSEMESKDSSK